MRVSVLLTALACVLVWAGCDIHRRRARNHWTETLTVALVVLGGNDLDPRAVSALWARKEALEDRLAEELRRHNPDAPKPFHFVLYGPVDPQRTPPAEAGAGWFDLIRYNFDLWRYGQAVNSRVGLAAGEVDATIYLVVTPPKMAAQTVIEGASQEGGKVGIVQVELDPSMVDFAFIVASHELFHTLGATDQYDSAGRTLIPSGLAEPDLWPLYPQRAAEIMARNIPKSPGVEVPPDSLDQLRVGATTAREIGWTH